jgi:multidrug efflux pump subunit AcrB
VALFFIPALFDKFPFIIKNSPKSIRIKRRTLGLINFYVHSIRFGKRFRWVFVLLFILGFGVPVHWLPDTIENDTAWAVNYNKTFGSEWFKSEAKPVLSKAMGGTLRLFTENVFENSFYAEPAKTKLYIRGVMPEGCTVQQLNEAIKKMENMISSFDEIELFQTSIYNAQYGSLVIHFKEAYEFTGFPYYLKEELTSKSIQLGGLDWSVWGVGRGFSNALNSGYKNNNIVLEGYNYEQLYVFAEKLGAELSKNERVQDLGIAGSTGWNVKTLQEYYLGFNAEKLALNDIELNDFYVFLKNKLFGSNIKPVFQNGELQQVTLVSNKINDFNGNEIYKKNQQYQLVVAYNFIGPSALSKLVKDKQIDELKAHLPLGYSVREENYKGWWNKNDKKQYYLIFLVIGIIYFICSILLESLRQPLAIIGMIPISFIGVFLTFYLFDFNFDQGGFASFILLCGIVVNAGLYIINDYNQLLKTGRKSGRLKMYVKAFNHKIIPIMLTIISTVMGLIPFVWNGQNEVFWFSFAVGSMGGLLFSLIALLVYLPLLLTNSSLNNQAAIVP